MKGSTSEEAAYWANMQMPEYHYWVARRVVSEPGEDLRLAVKAAQSPLARLPGAQRMRTIMEKKAWRKRAEAWWSSGDKEFCFCDNEGCLFDGENLSQSKELLRGEGFMPGGRPIYCEQCADERLYELLVRSRPKEQVRGTCRQIHTKRRLSMKAIDKLEELARRDDMFAWQCDEHVGEVTKELQRLGASGSKAA